MNIKEWIFKYYARKQPQRQAVFPDYENVRSVIVLYESDYTEKNTVIKAIRDALLVQDKDVVLWGWCDKKDITSLILPQSRIMGRRDINLLGVPKPEIIADLQKRQYDLLIDLSQKPCLPLKYIDLYVRADFHAGLKMEGATHDLLIDTAAQDSPQYLYEQIVRYLKMIKSK